MILLALALLAVPQPSPRIALTLSGGVSLGNYEAGLTWGVVRYLRASRQRGELAAVTGASAGAINALLAAALWCEDGSETRDDSPDSNLFLDAWTPIGLEDLLPDDASGFTATDGLLSSAPLERAHQRVRAFLFGSGGRRFRPGCAVSVGLTVTRDQPEEVRVAGLRARTQRFVIPWRFEVEEKGQARLVAAPLPSDRESAPAQLFLGEPSGGAGVGPLQMSEAILASGAFPFAFQPRELCDCAASCPDEDVVRDGTCEGPDTGRRTGGLSCSAIPPAGSRVLCRRRYIDGGIFDNAPIGLAVDLAEAAGRRPPPFLADAYFMVDPDFRRLAPETEQRSSTGLAAPAQLIANLIGTARETELVRSIRDERWQRTTQSVLADAALLHAGTLAVQEEMASIAGGDGARRGAWHNELLRSPRREKLGRFLLRCLGELLRNVDVETVPTAQCAEPLRDGTAGAGEREASRMTPAQVVELAEALARLFVASGKRGERVVAEMSAASTPMARQLQLLALARDVSTIATVSFRFLVGELAAIPWAGLGEEELQRLRRDLLTVAGGAGRLQLLSSAMLQVLLTATLLEEGQGELAATALQARKALGAGLAQGLDSPALRSMAAASERTAALIALAPRLRTLASQAATIAASAAQFPASNAAERRLTLSRRFSPLAGGQLLNFSGFLDRGLRELDFYLGVYDAAMQVTTFVCETQGPYSVAGRPAPIYREDDPLRLDVSALETQHCLGSALQEVFDALQLRRSARATFVVATLARLELAATVGSRSTAARVLEGPSWSWLGAPKLPADDQLAHLLTAVTSRTAPCRSGAAEALCLADPSFNEFLDAVQLSGYRPRNAPMREALADRDRWMARLAAKLLDRAATVELSSAERSGRTPSDALLAGVGLGALWSRRAQRLSASPAVDLDPSSLPAVPFPGRSPAILVAAHLIPYRVSLDVVRGGVALSWLEPAVRILPSLSIESIADVLNIEGSGRLASTVGLIPTVRFGGVALGAGAQYTLPWNGDRVEAPGIIGRIGLLQERLALTGGLRSTSPGPSGRRDGFVALSVSDLNGLVYWLALSGVKRN